MISVVLYGRNDSYGYNLHKRGALSLNCIAEVLDDPDDEILFVDWNTPDDFPTFPEAIADTLTARARRLLRILRVRPAQHARFAGRTHLVALEPPARNVAVRRANPANRWVLSTNTDMIFVPRGEQGRAGRSLSAIAAGLADGYYHLPRFEIPETLWEMLDRQDAAGTIARIGDWGWRYHLNEIVTLKEPAVRYDGPGDFQLALRSDLHDMHGFDERMLLGWHVDSNIAMRLGLRHGTPGDVVESVFGYHCDHTRQVTPAHKAGAVQNDWTVFVRGLTEQRAPEQPDWGLGDAVVEEVRLDDGGTYLAALDAAIPRTMAQPRQLEYGHGGHDRTEYDPDHVLPFVIDALCPAPRSTVVGWFGSDGALLAKFDTAWRALGFTTPVRAVVAAADGAMAADAVAAADAAEVLVFDFAMTVALRADTGGKMLDDPAIAAVADAFRAVVTQERLRLAGVGGAAVPRRFIAVNAVANSIEGVVLARIGAATAPYSTRLRQGFVRPLAWPTILPGIVVDMLAGAVPATGSATRAGPAGVPVAADEMVLETAPRAIMAGFYRVAIEIAADAPGVFVLEALADDQPLASRFMEVPQGTRRGLLFFAVAVAASPAGLPSDGQAAVVVSLRCHAGEGLRGRITALALQGSEVAGCPALDVTDSMSTGPAGMIAPGGLTLTESEGFVFFGPYVTLPAGRYRAVVDMELGSPDPFAHARIWQGLFWQDRFQEGRFWQARYWRRKRELPVAVLDVVDADRVLAEISTPDGREAAGGLEFTLEASAAALEVRLRKPAEMTGIVRRVTLERLGEAAR